jgi:agmatine/peptidylarginine deiminase
MNSKIVFPAEWATQSAVLMAWPHQNSDWAYMLDEVRACFSNIIKTIAQYEDVILLVSDKSTELVRYTTSIQPVFLLSKRKRECRQLQ